MTLKEEIECLRGEPINVFDGNPMNIPCIETSNHEKLCKHPVVSVQMITYNHESYIRQAIEGVMMQKTDFEFELVIGEDCSQDKTREICFEYQKKYPGKIRVLWWHENVSRLGGNGRRNRARCRGEFIAYCEGDDYWTDPFKLQKQVDVMRKYPNVGLVFTNGVLYYQGTGSQKDWDCEKEVPYGLIEGKQFLFFNIYSHSPFSKLKRESYLCTASVMIRVATLQIARENFEILSWKLRLGDVPMWLSLSSLSDVYGLPDKTICYRQHAHGMCASLGEPLWRDNLLVRIYFNRRVLGLDYYDLPPGFTSNWLRTNITILARKRYFSRVGALFTLFSGKVCRQMVIGKVVSKRLIEHYARYCNYAMEKKRWSFHDRCREAIRISGFIRLLIPDPLKKIWRKIMHRGEFA